MPTEDNTDPGPQGVSGGPTNFFKNYDFTDSSFWDKTLVVRRGSNLKKLKLK